MSQPSRTPIRIALFSSLLLALGACGGQGPSPSPDPASPGDGTPDSGAIAQPGGDTPGTIDPGPAPEDGTAQLPTPEEGGTAQPPTPEGGGTVQPAPEPVRFVVLGDTGRGDSLQFAVADAMKTVCADKGGCDFGLLVGDNFYPSGVSSVTDSQWDSKFERPYGKLGFPFYVVLGNHDYGNSGEGIDPARAQHEIDYSKKSDNWRMPAATYDFTRGPVDFLALDTQPLYAEDLQSSSTYPADQLRAMRERAQAQREGMAVRLARATHGWRIAFGHHPYLSNGPHGNAGRYDGTSGGSGAGLKMKAFVEEQLCGKVDLYLAGHDHSLQDLGTRCGTDFVVAGAGATTTSASSRNPVLFQSTASGFVLVEASQEQLHLSFFDKNARRLHERTIEKTPQMQ